MGKHMVLKRQKSSISLATLGDNASMDIDNTYGALLEAKGFLFEYQATGQLIGVDDSDWFSTQGNLLILLCKAGLSDADIDTILTAARIDPNDHKSYPEHQAIFQIAEFELVEILTGKASFNWKISFKPAAKGGIPMHEGDGFEMKAYNRTGGALTTGTVISTNKILTRFAYAE